MWVKICANTNLEDTQLAIDLGADAVGFVFAPSARQVAPAHTAHIISRLRPGPRPTEFIGVFQSASFEQIRDTVALAGLTGIQMHNAPNPQLIADLRQEFHATLTLTQTLHWVVGSPQDDQAAALAQQADALQHTGQIDRILVDTKAGSVLGGTGLRFDWDRALPLFRLAEKMPMIVAGGINPENVREAVNRLSPWGVDVASGVEQVPGRKDPERLRLFLHQARAAGEIAPP